MADGIEKDLRYACKGELHRDFHASILDGVNYVLDNYGEGALRKVMDATATGVYATMHEKLAKGDPSELLAWWTYYLDREGAEYALEKTSDGAVLTVSRCVALNHLKNREVAGGKGLCLATRYLNEGLCSGTPFEIVLEETGDFSCRQTLRLRKETDGPHA